MTGRRFPSRPREKAVAPEPTGGHPANPGFDLHSAAARRSLGSGLVEFAVVAFLLVMVIFAVFEFSRMLLVYTSVAHAARVAVHYATVNGAAKGTPATASSVCGVVTTYVTAVNTSAFTCNNGITGSYITVAWTAVGYSGVQQPGSLVQVTVVYKYDPFFSYLPLKVSLGSTAQGYVSY